MAGGPSENRRRSSSFGRLTSVVRRSTNERTQTEICSERSETYACSLRSVFVRQSSRGSKNKAGDPNHSVFAASYVFFFYRLVGLVVKASASRAENPGFEFRLRRDFSGSSCTSDLKISTPVAALPGAWHYRVSTGTGRTGVSIL